MTAPHNDTPIDADTAVRAVDQMLSGDDVTVDQDVVAETKMPDGKHKEQMPQLNVETFSSQIFWLIVTFLLMYLMVSRSILPSIQEIVEKRHHRRDSDLTRADKLTVESRKVQAAYEDMHHKAQDEASALIAKTQQELDASREQEMARIDHEIRDMLDKADRELGRKREAAAEALTPVARDIATRLVHELTGEQTDMSDLDVSGAGKPSR